MAADADDPGHAETDAALGPRPAADPLQRRVARARIASTLFATADKVELGRYHLLELIGAGGMGVVWSAWDPELDRRVAIKLVKATVRAARDRILLEGQALAKLSHPNVVPVFDVGVVDDQVYLVMEYVRGKDLRAFAREPHTVRELVAIYRDAGHGLAAAHRAGLIHRDFKPENAIVGDDGRVRVLDFGLARGSAHDPTAPDAGGSPASSELTRGAGTPRYMPPEQAAGGALTPAVDQYAFSVSLREALAGRAADGEPAAVPGWLEQILVRGSAPDPAARYASMDALLAALARDPRTVWRRRAIVIAALGLAGAAFAIGTLRGGDPPARCVGSGAEIAGVWNDARRDQLARSLANLGPFAAATAPQVLAELGRYRDGWQVAHRGACLAQDRGELPPVMYERTLACLARARASLAAVVDVLGAAPAEKLAEAVVAASSLPDASRCATDASLSVIAAPAAGIATRVGEVAGDVERARVLALARRDDAIDAADAAVGAATALGYQPLLARALLAQALAVMPRDRARAVTVLETATSAALAASDDPLAIEAYARLVYLTGTDQGAADVTASAVFLVPIAERTGPAGQFARALLYMNLGISEVAHGDRPGARTWFARSRTELDPELLRDHPELAFLPSNLAAVVDDPATRIALLTETRADLARLLGPDHPQTIQGEIRLAMFVDDPAVATATLRSACERLVELHPHARREIGDCAFELGWLAQARGDAPEARRWLERSVAHHAPETPQRALATALLELVDGRRAEAAERAERVAADPAHKAGWARMYAADASLVCALARRELGDRVRAVACYRRAVELLADLVEVMPGFARRLARARAELAEVTAGSR